MFGEISARPDAGAGRGWERLLQVRRLREWQNKAVDLQPQPLSRDSLKLQGIWSSVGGEGSWDEKHLGAPVPRPFLPSLSLGSLPHTPELTVPSACGLFILPSKVRVTVVWYLAPEAWFGVEEALAQMGLMV